MNKWISKDKITPRRQASSLLIHLQPKADLPTDSLRNNKLTEAEEEQYNERLKQELNQQEVEKLLEITTSYHRKGREEELIATVLLQVAKKFKINILPDKITQKIKSARIEQLSKIREDIFEIESLDDVMKYL